jgi:hypothetical protein
VRIVLNPMSLPPISSTIALIRTALAISVSWSFCGASPLWLTPPALLRSTFAVTAPEQAMLIVWVPGSRTCVIGATSDR